MQILEPATIGGGKKANGHKAECACPICKNMKHSKKGGSKMQEPATVGGAKKSNGHKAACACPICVNMKHQTASKKNRRVTRRGGRMSVPEPELINNKGNDNSALNNDDDNVPDVVVPQEPGVRNLNDAFDNVAARGGSRKKRKGNGHKATCMCPICKNMKKSGKKGGVLNPYETEKTKQPSDGEIDNMEKGIPTPLGEGAEKNVGGSRRRRARKSRKTRKTRRHH